MSKDFIVEVRIKYEEYAGRHELDLMSLFQSRSEDAIKRKLVDSIVKKYLDELPELEIDLSDLKERVKDAIVDRKVDEVLES